MPLSPLSRLLHRVGSVFCPPFRGLPVLAFCYFVIAYFCHKGNPLWHFNLPDQDDYLYLVQAIDQLKGQPWYDLFQHRMNPPEGTLVHYSKLLSGLYALPISVLAHWLGIYRAAMIVAALFPLLFLAGFFKAIIWMSATLIDKDWTRLTCFISMFLLIVTHQFLPGHVDHHGLEIMLAAMAYGATNHFIRNPSDIKMAAAAGTILAFAMLIGLEILPVLLILVSWVGLWAIVEGRQAAKAGLLLGIALSVTGFILFLTSAPFSALFSSFNVAIYSTTYVTLMAGIGVSFLAVYTFSFCIPSLLWRLGACIGFVLVLGILFMLCFPDLWSGPLGGADPLVVQLISKSAGETKPLFLHKGFSLHLIGLPLMALVASYDLWRRQDAQGRWMVGLLVMIIVCTYLLAIFYAQRFYAYTGAFILLPLAYASQRIWLFADRYNKKWKVTAWKILALLLVGPLTAVILPGLLSPSYVMSQRWLIPERIFQKRCNENGLAFILNQQFGDHPHLIINTLESGPELLFRTNHYVLAGPFHMNGRGNRDSYDFFSATNANDALSIARRRGADLVVVCRVIEPIYVDPDAGKIIPDAPKPSPPNPHFFINQLINGPVPSWLVPVTDPVLGNFLLFKII